VALALPRMEGPAGGCRFRAPVILSVRTQRDHPDGYVDDAPLRVMERTSNSERHPYKSVVEDWDSQNYDAWLMEAFEPQGQTGSLGIPEGVERELKPTDWMYP